jgi:hypothetical protein
MTHDFHTQVVQKSGKLLHTTKEVNTYEKGPFYERQEVFRFVWWWEDNSYEFGAERVLANSARVFYTLFSLVGSQ